MKIARVGPGGVEMVLALLLPGDAVGKLFLFEPDAVYPALDPGVLGCCAENRQRRHRGSGWPSAIEGGWT
jgi:hypothetical protein